MSTTGYEGLEDESISDNKLEMNMFVSVNSTSQKIDLSLYNITLATVPPGFCLSAKSGKKVPLGDLHYMYFRDDMFMKN